MKDQEKILYFNVSENSWQHWSSEFSSNNILDTFNNDSNYYSILKKRFARVAHSRQILKTNSDLKSQPLKSISYLLEANHVKGYNAARKVYHLNSDQLSSYFLYLNLYSQLSSIPELSFLPIQQLYLSKEVPNNILLCFTGRTGRLNMPLPIFHSLTSKHFDCIVYLYDPFNDYYSSVEHTIKLAVDNIKNKWPAAKLSSLSTSTGGIMAHKLGSAYESMKKLSFSPLLSKSNFLLEEIKNQNGEIFKATRFFFALGTNNHQHKSVDTSSLKCLLENLGSDFASRNIYNLGFLNSSHATLLTLMLINSKAYRAQIDWLIVN